MFDVHFMQKFVAFRAVLNKWPLDHACAVTICFSDPPPPGPHWGQTGTVAAGQNGTISPNVYPRGAKRDS